MGSTEKAISCSVLMGDIVGSRKTVAAKKQYIEFNRQISLINKTEKRKILSPLTITLGDEFQGLVQNLSMAFALALKIRHALLAKEISCRMVVGQSEVQLPQQRKTTWNILGKGLAEAREKLNKKEDQNCYRFSLELKKSLEIEALLLDGLGRSLTEIEKSWTNTQREYILITLESTHLSRAQIAKKLKVTESSLFKVLRSGQYQHYFEQIKTVQSALNKIDSQRGTR